MEDQYTAEACCSIRAFFHTWNNFLIFITLNKVYFRFWTSEPLFYGHYLEPISLVSFIICNLAYILSAIFSENVKCFEAVAYLWVVALALIYPAAIIDRTLYYVDNQTICPNEDKF